MYTSCACARVQESNSFMKWGGVLSPILTEPSCLASCTYPATLSPRSSGYASHYIIVLLPFSYGVSLRCSDLSAIITVYVPDSTPSLYMGLSPSHILPLP